MTSYLFATTLSSNGFPHHCSSISMNHVSFDMICINLSSNLMQCSGALLKTKFRFVKPDNVINYSASCYNRKQILLLMFFLVKNVFFFPHRFIVNLIFFFILNIVSLESVSIFCFKFEWSKRLSSNLSKLIFSLRSSLTVKTLWQPEPDFRDTESFVRYLKTVFFRLDKDV